MSDKFAKNPKECFMEVISDDNLSGCRVKVVEKDGFIYIYKPIVNEIICTHEISIGQVRVLSIKKGHTDLETYKSGVGLFSSKIKCGECGLWYGSKVWHSTDKYKKTIYRCNHKYGICERQVRSFVMLLT